MDENVVDNAYGLKAEEWGGVQFTPATAISQKGVGRQWGGFWEKPAFTDLAGFADAIAKMDVVKTRPVYLVDAEAGEAEEIAGKAAVQSTKTGKVYSVMTTKYLPVQDYQIAQPLYEAAADLGLRPMGNVHGVGTGRTTGYILLGGLDAVELGAVLDPRADMRENGHRWVDMAVPGIHFWNSFTGKTGFGADIFLNRRMCNNLCMQGDLLGKLGSTHRGTLQGMEQGFKNLIKNLAAKLPGFIKQVEKAKEREVTEVELPDLYWGLGDVLAPTVIDELVRAPEKLTPEIVPGHMNVWNASNVLSAYISWLPGGTTRPKLVDRIASTAGKLLTADIDKLIAKGQERREAFVEKRKREEEAKEKKDKRAAEAVLVGGIRAGLDEQQQLDAIDQDQEED